MFLVLTLVTFIAVRALFVPGFLPTHDGEYHLIRFYEFGRMLAAGHVFPRWAPGLNSGHGVPLFTFFYPLPNYIGSFFHFLGWNFADSFRLTMAVGYVTAISASYFWLKRYYGEFSAMIGSIIGAFVPYWFVDMFVRGSVGEVLALGFVFAALASIAYEKRTLLALAVAGIILSHNIIAMIFLPILFLYIWMTDRSTLHSMIVGVILTSYFWLPALVERGYVVGLNMVNYKDHFPELAQLLIPSWGTGLSGSDFALDEMSYQIGIVPMFILLTSSVLILRKNKIARLFIVTAWVAIFLMLGVSVPVWEQIPFLANLQYPWRLLSVLIVATPLLSASILSKFRLRAVSLGLTAITIMLSFGYTKPVLYEPRPDDYYLSRREFTDGTSSLGNTFGTRWIRWQPNRSDKRMEVARGEGTVFMRRDGDTTFVGVARLITDGAVRVNVAYYPGWRVAIDGNDTPVKPDGGGMITVPVPKGDHSIAVNFSETPLRLAADILSILCLFWLFCSTILKKAYEYSYRYHSS